MTNIKKHMMVATMGLFAAAALIGCTKTEEIYIADLYQMAYISTDIVPGNESTFTQTTVPAHKSLTFSSGVVSFVDIAEVTNTSGTANPEFYFRTVYPVKTDLRAEVGVFDDAEEVVAAYNDANGTDYQLMPAVCYTLSTHEVTIKAGYKQADEKIVVEINPDEVKNLTTGLYLVPVTIRLAPGSGIDVSTTSGTMYIKANVAVEQVSSEEGRILTSDDFTWENVVGYEGVVCGTFSGNINNLFDADYSTAWMSQPNYPRLKITFKQPVALRQMMFVVWTYYTWYYRFGYSRFAYTLEDGTYIDFPNDWYEYPNHSLSTTLYQTYNVLNDISADARVKEALLDIDSYYGYVGLTDIYFIVAQ